MRSLVTGGAGFIGSHLVDELVRRGDEVTVLDDLSTGRPGNLAAAEATGRLQVVVGSVTDEALLPRLVDRADRVFHLAAAVGVKRIVENPLTSLETNVLGGHRVMSAAARSGKPLLNASTSEIYGKHPGSAYGEETPSLLGPVTQPRWLYAAGKLVDEFLARALVEEQQARIVTARLFNISGPRQRGQYGMVLPRFVGAALRGDALQVYGDGTQTRCFCHVLDCVRVLVELVEAPGAWGEAVNVGSPEPVTIAELARLVLEITDSDSAVIRVPLDQVYGRGIEDIHHRVPDVTKLRALMGFAPAYSLHDIIRDVTDYLSAEPGLQ